MSRLANRALMAEQMDDPDLPAAIYESVLSDLCRVNRWTLAARPTLAFLRRASAGRTRLRILDVGFGHGDMLRAVARWALRTGVEVELVGVDLNIRSVAAAEAATAPDLGIRFTSGDYRDMGDFDIILSSLVAHHMDDDELLLFVRHMEAHALCGWMVNDLHRHPLAFHGYPWLARFLRVHPIVRADGRLSIARAFRPGEWRAILAAAGVPETAAHVRRHFPFRLCVERLR